MSDPSSIVAALSRAVHRIRVTPPRIIASPKTQPRRAAVALIIRVVPSPFASQSSLQNVHVPETLSDFFSLDWVNEPGATAEILFLRRDAPQSENSVVQNTPRNVEDAHLAFPGGRMEEGDEGGLYTAMRQTWEEIGIDLAEKDFMLIGQLDDREITTSLGKRLLMILSPFVFLQVTPKTPAPDPGLGTHLHWIPLSSLLASASIDGPKPKKGTRSARQWTNVTVDVASRLTPRHSTTLRLIVRMFLGSMQFNAILLESTETSEALRPDGEKAGAESEQRREILKLWGLSLGMTLDFIAHMHPASSPFSVDYPRDEVTGLGTSIAPSMTSVFPRFSYPDVNFWIWVFGKRYREVIRSWEASARNGGANDRRINWIGTAVNQFYAAVRKALIIVLILRAIGILVALGFGTWWFFAQ
ncbi:uncharacterized protein FOMMEDRAFT_140381 [Fomitiporia mediterranea MF3/22]|uniref:uncharacterized protein n=1 Tax=Fomitiporia mediterranea (strain MF3/22) TaxID=694068 RepID=UPI0004408818|nr:uncharacterized protein FOMMEDRAFT_140381 [Fomitiporia mediterranea MF3/22]EJD04422.1 hypothetical protein FOMMEDRAFT_140381 [Fomitiporia mediterranea MF3/22]